MPTREQIEHAEDIIGDAIQEGVRFGVRCGCPNCDARAAEVIRRVAETLTPTPKGTEQ